MDTRTAFALVVMLCAPCWVAVFVRPLRRHMLAFWVVLLLVILHYYPYAILAAFMACAWAWARHRSWR